MPDLEEIIARSAAADGPALVQSPRVDHSWIDPCGLRETNFDMMNQVCDGLNNVARHIRPFTLVAWAWRRAIRLAEANAVTDARKMEDFVSRCEVIFAWSLNLADRSVDVPGGQALAPIISSDSYHFGGPAWQDFNKVRRNSTSLSAAANYGPGLKSLGWVVRNATNPNVLVPTPEAAAPLDAFEELIADRLDHPAFSSLDPVTVTADEVRAWADAWSLHNLTDAERRHAARALAGDLATATRASGISLLVAAATLPETPDGEQAVIFARNAAAGEINGFDPPEGLEQAAARWRKLQFRQLFRYSIESLLAWSLDQLSDGLAKNTQALVEAFLMQSGLDGEAPAGTEWLDMADPEGRPSAATSRIWRALREPDRQDLAGAIAEGLALCIANAPDTAELYDRDDRLPLRKAASQAEARRYGPTRKLVEHAIENWTFAQHVYWAVGRGLQDARSGGKKIVRLKLLMEEGGWTVLPGTGRLTPEPTPDRIRTALSLATESGLIAQQAA